MEGLEVPQLCLICDTECTGFCAQAGLAVQSAHCMHCCLTLHWCDASVRTEA
jgi:hypothetical protein